MTRGSASDAGPSGLDHPPFAPGGDPDRVLYFLHIQKCAGTSVRAFLESLVRPEQVLPAYLLSDIADFSVLNSPGLRLVRGHMLAELIGLFERPPFVITTLREPVSRLLSHVEFEKKRRRLFPNEILHSVQDLTLGETLSIPQFRNMVFNSQSRSLMRSGSGSSLVDPGDVDAYGQITRNAEVPIDEMVDMAIETLDQMDWIGITEIIDQCMPVLASHVGASPAAVLPETNALDVARDVQLSGWVADLVAELTAADEVVYRHAYERARRDIRVYDREEHVRRWSRTLTERAVDLDNEIVVRADEPFGGSSWWPADPGSESEALRWSGPSDRATIDLPLRVRPGDLIELHIRATVKPEMLGVAGMEVNGRAVDARLDTAAGIVLRGTVPAGAQGPWTTIVVCCPTIPWREIHPETEDVARRGLAFSSLRLVPARN